MVTGPSVNEKHVLAVPGAGINIAGLNGTPGMLDRTVRGLLLARLEACT